MDSGGRKEGGREGGRERNMNISLKGWAGLYSPVLFS